MNFITIAEKFKRMKKTMLFPIVSLFVLRGCSDQQKSEDDEMKTLKALSLDKDYFYLLGQSWGGILAMECALKHQGPSEFGMTGNATLKDWDITEELSKISVTTLIIESKYDTMDQGNF
jgi:pimeloyl-ACP methyl ester carboxylesterase